MESLNASSALLLQEEAEGLFGCVSTFKKLNFQENVMLKYICTLNVDSHGIQKIVQHHQKNSEMRQKKRQLDKALASFIQLAIQFRKGTYLFSEF